MSRFGMVIDTRKCVGCMDCVVACQTENDVPQGHCRDWITTEVRGEFPRTTMEIRSERCNHCDSPPCVSCCARAGTTRCCPTPAPARGSSI